MYILRKSALMALVFCGAASAATITGNISITGTPFSANMTYSILASDGVSLVGSNGYMNDAHPTPLGRCIVNDSCQLATPYDLELNHAGAQYAGAKYVSILISQFFFTPLAGMDNQVFTYVGTYAGQFGGGDGLPPNQVPCPFSDTDLPHSCGISVSGTATETITVRYSPGSYYNYYISQANITLTHNPEPGTWLMMAGALSVAGLHRRFVRKRRRALSRNC